MKNNINNNKKVVTRLNPLKYPKPVGKYSHVTHIAKNAEWYSFSGQIGIDINENIPEDFNEQVKNTLNNISNLLKSQNLSPENVVKVNIWATEEIDWDYFDDLWDHLFNVPSPSMTIAYITALGLPELKIEIDIWAAK
ncbi:RidA family protein [Clostridium sp. Marseille-QA1073]